MIELRNDDRDCLDELVGSNCYVHLERMAENYFCLIVEDGSRRVMLNVGTGPKYKRRVLATVYADERVTPAPTTAAHVHKFTMSFQTGDLRCQCGATPNQQSVGG